MTMKTTKINVKGMHCNSCKLLLEKSLSQVDQIKSVEANVKKGTIQIGYEQDFDFDDIKNIVHECGYEISDEEINRPWLSKNLQDYKILLISLLSFIFFYLILNKTGIISFDIKSQGSPSLSLVLLIGLTAGFSSCMAVVGGLVLAISSKWNKNNDKQNFGQKIVPHFRFNAGRVIGFGILGGILGVFGSVISLSPFMMSVMTLIVGAIMIMLGINLTHISPKLSAISLSLPTGKLFAKKETDVLKNKSTGLRKYLGSFGSGILTFFLPCGFTFAMQLYAMSTGSFFIGMAIMAIFAIGTLPGLIGIGSLTSLFKGKTAQITYKAIGVLVILLGLYNISNSYNVIATRLNTTKQQDTSTLQNNQQVGEIINMTYTDKGLTPSVINLEVGKPYTIIIDVQTSIYGCMSTIYIPGLDENIQSIKNGSQIKFSVNPTTPGTYELDCAMGISHQTKIIVQ